ncbi:hypothetical protein QBC47DRAFT_389034 [Echria macrotheca]|uniref:Uncharacterized protein n=1 Tax=Echria macrotheca TaxID=438768 RepID=A0AAJ0F903_9PEZI|nr:hypothetical protein QBC47DRAFT_389034 [Echria macrotheca]
MFQSTTVTDASRLYNCCDGQASGAFHSIDVSMASSIIEALSTRLGSAFRLQDPLKFFSWPERENTFFSQTSATTDSEFRKPSATPRDGPLARGTFANVTREETGESLSTLVDHQTTLSQDKVEETYRSRSPSSIPGPPLALRNGIPLPGTQDMIWLYHPVRSARWSEDVHRARFRYVINELKKAVEGDDTLCSRLNGFTWDLYMVGTSPETSTPAIVVGCHKNDEDDLLHVFYRCAQRRLNCRVNPEKRLRPRMSFSTRTPAFNIFILPRPTVPVTFMAADQLVVSSGADQRILCGNLVHFEGRTATLGISLRVGDVDRVLTVQHLFEPHPPPTSAGCPERAIAAGIPSTSAADRVQPPHGLNDSAAYLDWSLMDIPGSTAQHNTLFEPPMSVPVQLQEIGPNPSRHETPVYMVSGLYGIRKGTLIGEMSYISTTKGRELCPVWKLVMDSGAIERGESGSVIFNRETHQVYGHVIGADTYFGFGYVVPLAKTIEQIKTAFNTSDVSISALPSETATELLATPSSCRISHPNTEEQPDGKLTSQHSAMAHSGLVAHFKSVSMSTLGVLALPSIHVSAAISTSIGVFKLLLLGAVVLLAILKSFQAAHMRYQIQVPTDTPSQHHWRNAEIATRLQATKLASFDYGIDFKILAKSIHDSPFVFAKDIQSNLYYTYQGYENLDGSSWSTFYTDAAPMLMTWILPLILLLANIEVSPLDNRRFYTWFRILGNPIDAIWSLLHKLQTWSRLYELARSELAKRTRDIDENRATSNIKVIATVLFGFEEALGPDISALDLPQELIQQFDPGVEDMFNIWQATAFELADGGTDGLLRTCVAIMLYIFQILAALIFADNIGQSASSVVATALCFSLLLPAVFLSNVLGTPLSPQAVRRTLRRFLSRARVAAATDAGSHSSHLDWEDLESILMADYPEEHRNLWSKYFHPLSFKGGKGPYRQWKAAPSRTQLHPERNSTKFGALGMFLMAMFPVLVGGLGAQLLTRGPFPIQNRPLLGFTIHLWLLSATISFGLRAIGRFDAFRWLHRYGQRLSFAFNLFSSALNIVTALIASTGALDQLLWRVHNPSTSWACVPLSTDGGFYRERYELHMSVAIFLGVLWCQLGYTLVVGAVYWKGILAARWSNSKRKQLLGDSQPRGRGQERDETSDLKQVKI